MVEVGTLRGSGDETALDATAPEDVSTDEDDAGEPDCAAVEPFGVDRVVTVDDGARMAGATPAELVWACTAPKPASHIAVAKMNMRCIAFSRTGTEVPRTVC